MLIFFLDKYSACFIFVYYEAKNSSILIMKLQSVKFERLINSKCVVVVFKTTIIPLSRVYSNLEEQDKKLNTLVEWLKKNNIHIN